MFQQTTTLKEQKILKEQLDDFICEMQSDLAKFYTQMLLSPDRKNFNGFIS